MAAAGIQRDAPYAAEHVTTAFSDALGHRVALHCSHKGVPSELWMCIDASLTPFDCPENVLRPCHGAVTFESFQETRDRRGSLARAAAARVAAAQATPGRWPSLRFGLAVV